MPRLLGGTHFLVLRGTAKETDLKQVHCYPRFDDALASWDGYSRISPIFALDGSSPPKLSTPESTWLFFMGPVFPGALDHLDFAGAYLTLGIFNVILFCANPAQLESAHALAVRF